VFAPVIVVAVADVTRSPTTPVELLLKREPINENSPVVVAEFVIVVVKKYQELFVNENGLAPFASSVTTVLNGLVSRRTATSLEVVPSAMFTSSIPKPTKLVPPFADISAVFAFAIPNRIESPPAGEGLPLLMEFATLARK
jgi:hypothetical protein